MSKKAIILIITSVLVILAFIVGYLCGFNSHKSPQTSSGGDETSGHTEATFDLAQCYSVTYNGDFTYCYQVTDQQGNVLLCDDHSAREPSIEQVDTNILGVTIQTGTGLSSNWAIYCDVEKGQISETFQYVLGAQGNYVIYVTYENKQHSIVVQDIFDKVAYCQTYLLENCSPVAADVVVSCAFNGNGTATITYLTGEDYTETDLTIGIP